MKTCDTYNYDHSNDSERENWGVPYPLSIIKRTCDPISDFKNLYDCEGNVYAVCCSCYQRGIRDRIPIEWLDHYGCQRQGCMY